MKLKSLFTVAAIAVAGFTSNVASADTSLTLTPNASFSHTVAAGFFTDIWTFTLPSASTVAGSLTNVAITFGSFDYNIIAGFAATLDGFTPLTYSTTPVSIPGGSVTTQLLSGTALFAAGSHTLTVTGTAGLGGASYGGNMVAVPVPEPESYAMLLAGLGLMGTIARRRNKASKS